MPYTRISNRVITKSNWRFVQCSFCWQQVRYRDLQRHFRESCPEGPQIPFGQKVCSSCQRLKLLSDFPSCKTTGHKDGRSNLCHKCDCAATKEWYTDPTHNRMRRDRSLRFHYGITSDDYDRLLAAQSGNCAICGCPQPTTGRQRFLHVDHDHATGHIRGLLCQHCNHAIGKLKDNPRILTAAIEYLQRVMDSEKPL